MLNKELDVILFSIIENSNRDIVVVVVFMVVIVKDYIGKYCFFYSGNCKGLEFWFIGLCVDVLVYILVLDVKSKVVYMIDKNGWFLFYLLLLEKFVFWFISYDVNIYCLLVLIFEDNILFVYSYII